MRNPVHPLLLLLVFAAAALASAGAASAATVSCSAPNVDCAPCCPGCSTCTDNRPCILGSFTAINHPSSGDRTGFKVCGSDASSKTVTFHADGKTADVAVSGFNCVTKHLDQLSWNGGQPDLHSLETATFTVDGPNPGEDAVSMVTSITFTGTYYNLYRLDSCQGPIQVPICPPGCTCDEEGNPLRCDF